MDAQQLKTLITGCCLLMDNKLRPSVHYNRPEAVQLLLGTACVESDCGYFIEQIGGPALGIYQMEPATHDDIWRNYINHRQTLRSFLFVHSGLTEKITNDVIPLANILKWNLRYATMMARLHYYRVVEPIPTTTPTELATYWKRYYNTPAGRGRIEDFLIKTRQYHV